MSQHKIYIVEDEPLISDTIKQALEKEDFIVCGIADNATLAINDLNTISPDLVLLDINIEGALDGVELAHIINDKFKIPFIFLTSLSDKKNIERVKFTNPAGFINKPFNENGLRNNIEIALHKYHNSEKTTQNNTSESVFVKNKGELVRLEKADILFAEAFDNYTYIYNTKGKFLLSFTLKSVQKKLDDKRFVRVHKSFFVNANLIESLADGYLFIGKHKIPIGKTYREELMKEISLL